MRPCRAVSVLLLLLLLPLLGPGGATTPGPSGATRPGPDGATRPGSAGPSSAVTPSSWALSYGDVVSAAVELLNARALSPYVLRLREAQARPGWSQDLRQRQDLSFTVEETSCRAPGTPSTPCNPRWLGGVSWCRGSVFLEEQQPTVELSCEKMPGVLGRVHAPWLTSFFSRIKEKLRGFFYCGKIWIRDRLNLKKPKS